MSTLSQRTEWRLIADSFALALTWGHNAGLERREVTPWRDAEAEDCLAAKGERP